MKKLIQQGVSLVEVLTAVAILAILAGASIPSYRDYVTRSKVAKALLYFDAQKPLIEEYFTANGSLPTGCANTVTTPDIYQSESDLNDGLYQERGWCLDGGVARLYANLYSSELGLNYGTLANGNNVVQVNLYVTNIPTAASEQIEWVCGTLPSAELKCRHLPASCQYQCIDS